MRAISAPRSHRTVKMRSPLPRGPSIAKRPKRRSLRDERTALADVFPGVGELLGHAAPVAQPHGALHFLIGAAKEIEDDRRVARAAGVLQEQRVEKLRLVERRQPERFADAKSDEAASRGVAAGMSFSQIERVRQTLENARQSKPGRRNATRGVGASMWSVVQDARRVM